MRSFIKAHRRGESASSDFFESEPEPKAPLSHKTTPVPSPIISNGPFTPPSTSMAASGAGPGSASLSSPKKLLTPIKKMFSSSTHAKSAVTTPTSGDSLQNAVGSRTRRKIRGHRHTRSQGSVSNISELSQPESGLALDSQSIAAAAAAAAASKYATKLAPSPHFHTSASSPSLANSYKQFAMPISNSHTSLSSFQSSGSHPSTTQTKLNPPINLIDTPKHNLLPDSIQEKNETSSLAEDPIKPDTKSVSFDHQIQSPPPTPEKKFSIHGENNKSFDYAHDLEQDYEGDDSDSSSQFSFVKDSNCGRNTSVKYYKVVKTPQVDENEFQQSNTFNENDLGIDVDEFSDYDFENNGMDDGYDDDFDEEADNDVQYNKLFDEDDEPAPRTGSLSSSEQTGTKADVDTASSSDLNDNFMESDANDSYYGNDTDEDVPYNSAMMDDTAEMTIDGGHKIMDPSMNESSLLADQTVTQEKTSKQNSLPPNDGKHSVFYKSYHLSIQGFDSFDEADGAETDAYGDDILENYLDVSKSPSLEATGSFSGASDGTPDPLTNDQLYEVSSPIINGLTIGNNLRHRLPRLNSYDSEKESSSINNMFINRSILDLNEGQNADLFRPSYQSQVSQSYNLRSLRSFHQSISDDLNRTILEKTDEFVKFVAQRSEDQIQKSIGLGISQDKQNNIKEEKKTKASNPRHSVIELMSLLGDLETSKDQSAKKSKEEVRDSALTSLETPQTISESDSKDRQSIVGMMSILADLEKTQVNILEENNRAIEKAQQNRRSILDMMSTLASLETSSNTEEAEKSKRNSINNMMQTLANLDLSGPSTPSANERIKARNQSSFKKGALSRLKEDSQKDKRYSWFNNDESVNFSSLKPPIAPKPPTSKPEQPASESEAETSDAEAYNRTLDADILDEINQLPEDYDFDELTNRSNSVSQSDPAFFRSNSYNKKPIKALMDNQYQCNKIETSSKTVTFYRSNSNAGSLETARTKSVSRAPSMRSMNSFTSVNEEAEEEDEEPSFGGARNEQTFTFVAHRKKPALAYNSPQGISSPKPTISFR